MRKVLFLIVLNKGTYASNATIGINASLWNRSDILDYAAEMPTFHLKANQAEADIQELKNQNSFLHGEVKALKSELATRPTLAVLKQEINKYSSGDRLTSSALPSGGLQGLPKLD